MPYDSAKAISANDIKNGSIVTNTLFTGRYQTYNYYVKNTPTLTSMQNKYIDRFDDPSYYYGNGVQGSGHL